MLFLHIKKFCVFHCDKRHVYTNRLKFKIQLLYLCKQHKVFLFMYTFGSSYSNFILLQMTKSSKACLIHMFSNTL